MEVAARYVLEPDVPGWIDRSSPSEDVGKRHLLPVVLDGVDKCYPGP